MVSSSDDVRKLASLEEELKNLNLQFSEYKEMKRFADESNQRKIAGLTTDIKEAEQKVLDQKNEVWRLIGLLIRYPVCN